MRRGLAGLRARPTVAAALLCALLALGFVSPALLPGRTLSNSDSFWFQPPWVGVKPASLERPSNPEFDDAPSQIQPFVQFTRRALPDVPLWNPHIVAGRPFEANAQSGVFSPFNLPAYVLPFFSALALIAALKIFAATFGAYLLGRALGMRFGGAMMAGAVYGLNLWMVAWLSYPHGSVYALIPLLLVLTERVVRRPDLLSGAGLAVGSGVVFVCGHPESSFHAVVAAVAFFILRAGQARRSGESPAVPVRRSLLAFAGALGGGLALAAVVIVPFAELLFRSADLAQRAGSARDSFVDRRYLLGLALPDYWGRPTQTPLEFFLLARAFYGGALPLLLAGAALILRPTPLRLAIAGFGAAAMAVVAGIPPVFQIVTALPLFSSGHNTRLVVLYMACLALLAGFGLDDLTQRRRPSRRRLRTLAVFAAVVVAAPLAWVAIGQKTTLAVLGDALEVAFGLADQPGPAGAERAGDTIRLSALILWLTLAGGGSALLALRLRGRLGATALATAAVALVAVDLARAGMGYNPAIDRDIAVQPATGAIRYLQGRRPARFVAVDSPAERAIPQNAIPMRFGLYEARGYDLPVERRYDRLWRSLLSPEFPSQVGPFLSAIALTLPKLDERRLRTLDLLGVADVMQPKPSPPLGVPGLELAYEGPDARVYANPGALPRAFVVGGQRVVAGGDAALREITRPGFEPRGAAVVERAVEGVSTTAFGPAGRARIAAYERERVLIEASAERPSLLVLSDLHYPGWRASVDGREVTVERVDYAFRGVRLDPGRHTVEFTYRPLSWRVGWLVSLFAGAALIAAVLRGRRTRAASAIVVRATKPSGGAPPETSPSTEERT